MTLHESTLEDAGRAAGRADSCRRRYWIALGIITLGGAALRFATLDGQSFWFDEAVTRWLVRLPLGDMLSQIPKTERTPPGYYVIAWFWVKVFGAGEVGLRSLSALLGTGVILATAAAASALTTRRVALVAALLVAVNPLLVWYSQEARAYALLALLSVLGFAAFVSALDRPRTRTVVAWSLLSAAALATHYFAAFLVVPEAVALLVFLRPRRLAALSVGFVAATAAALVPLFADQRCNNVDQDVGATSIARFVPRLAKNDLIGFNIQGGEEVILATLALAAVLLALALGTSRHDPRTRRALLLVGTLVASAVGALLVLAAFEGDLLNERYLLGVVPILIVGVAAALGTQRAGRLGLAGVGVLTAVSIAAVILTAVKPEFQRQDWRGLTHALPPAASRAIVISPDEDGAMSLEPYISSIHRFPAAGATVGEVDVAMLPLQPWRSGEQPDGASVTRQPRTLPTPAAPVRGLRLVSRVDTDSFTLIRYRASAPLRLKPQELVRARLDRAPRPVVLYVARDSPPTAASELDLGCGDSR